MPAKRPAPRRTFAVLAALPLLALAACGYGYGYGYGSQAKDDDTEHVVAEAAKIDKKYPKVVEAVLRGSVETNAWIKANPEKAKAVANARLKEDSGKALPAEVLDPAWESLQLTDDPLASTLDTEARHAVKAGLLEKPDLAGIYDLTLLNKVLRAEGEPEADDAGLGAE